MAAPFIEITGKGLDVLNAFLKDAPKQIPKETMIVLNLTAKDHKRAISKRVRSFVAIDTKGANESIAIKKATKGRLTATVRIDPGFRPSLKRFKAKQTKAGVSYKIDKKGGRKTVAGAFGPNIPRLGNHVYKRENGKLKQLRGVSLWGVYLKRNMIYWSDKEVREALEKQVQRRIRALIFKAKKQGS